MKYIWFQNDLKAYGLERSERMKLEEREITFHLLILVNADAISPVGTATVPKPIISTKNVNSLLPTVIG